MISQQLLYDSKEGDAVQLSEQLSRLSPAASQERVQVRRVKLCADLIFPSILRLHIFLKLIDLI